METDSNIKSKIKLTVKEFKEIKKNINIDIEKLLNLCVKSKTEEEKEDIMKNISSELVEELNNICNLISEQNDSNCNVDNIKDIINNLTNLKEFLIKRAKEIENYDLSLIPSEEYIDFSKLSNINFENTGAQLDFNKNNYIVTGSIKGCTIKSFNPDKYICRKSNFLILENAVNIECLDIEGSNIRECDCDTSQYQIILDGYREHKNYLPEECYWLLKNLQIQVKNKWVFDRVLKNIDENLGDIKFTSIWKIMKPQIQEEYNMYLDDFIDKYPLNLNKILCATAEDILDKKFEKILKKFLNNDFDHIFDFLRFWENMSEQFQESHAKILEEYFCNTNIFLWMDLFKASCLNARKEFFRFLEENIDKLNITIVDLAYLNILKNKNDTDLEFQSILNYLLNDANICYKEKIRKNKK